MFYYFDNASTWLGMGYGVVGRKYLKQPKNRNFLIIQLRALGPWEGRKRVFDVLQTIYPLPFQGLKQMFLTVVCNQHKYEIMLSAQICFITSTITLLYFRLKHKTVFMDP